MFTVKKITLETISLLTVINFFVGIAHAQSLGLRKVNTTGTTGATRGECLAVIPLLPITEVSSTKSLQPFLWVYIIPPEDKDAVVVLSHTDPDDITIDSKPERVTANKPSFIRFSLPISNQESPKNQLKANQEYALKIKCLGSGSAPTVAIKNEADNLNLSNLSFEQRMFEFAKLNLWAELVDSLFDKRFICSNRSKGAALFANLVKNELSVEEVFRKSIGSIEIEKMMIKDFDEFHKSRCKK